MTLRECLLWQTAPCASARTANLVCGKRVGTTLNVCADIFHDSYVTEAVIYLGQGTGRIA